MTRVPPPPHLSNERQSLLLGENACCSARRMLLDACLDRPAGAFVALEGRVSTLARAAEGRVFWRMRKWRECSQCIAGLPLMGASLGQGVGVLCVVRWGAFASRRISDKEERRPRSWPACHARAGTESRSHPKLVLELKIRSWALTAPSSRGSQKTLPICLWFETRIGLSCSRPRRYGGRRTLAGANVVRPARASAHREIAKFPEHAGGTCDILNNRHAVGDRMQTDLTRARGAEREDFNAFRPLRVGPSAMEVQGQRCDRRRHGSDEKGGWLAGQGVAGTDQPGRVSDVNGKFL